jgi:hypothetical protein
MAARITSAKIFFNGKELTGLDFTASYDDLGKPVEGRFVDTPREAFACDIEVPIIGTSEGTGHFPELFEEPDIVYARMADRLARDGDPSMKIARKYGMAWFLARELRFADRILRGVPGIRADRRRLRMALRRTRKTFWKLKGAQ